ncbi:DUF397 domain-containing protein, partial [Streptomyces lunaelactis]|nr:DUF397 domain-containing protein [Streptomyces lunaelactis]
MWRTGWLASRSSSAGPHRGSATFWKRPCCNGRSADGPSMRTSCGACVEIAACPATIHVRDSKHPDG